MFFSHLLCVLNPYLTCLSLQSQNLKWNKYCKLCVYSFYNTTQSDTVKVIRLEYEVFSNTSLQDTVGSLLVSSSLEYIYVNNIVCTEDILYIYWNLR